MMRSGTYVIMVAVLCKVCGQMHDDEIRERRSTLKTEDLRFNKFWWPSQALRPHGFKPLKRKDYPIMGYVNETLRSSNAVSVITLDDYEVQYDIPRMIEGVGGMPAQPSPNPNNEFWGLLREVMRVQEIRVANPNTRLFVLPDDWKNDNLNQIAERVHNEYPGTEQAVLLDNFVGEKWGKLDVDLNIIPWRTNSMFLRREFMMAQMNTWAMSKVGPHNFAAKWFAGRARPEEVVWAIKTGRIRDGVPLDILRAVQFLPIRSAREFTAYPEGSPRHPSWPAMHAASASVSFWGSVVLNMNDDQLCQARLTDYAISYARTVAGVHYPDDNIAGLNMAQEVLARAMPRYLKETYDADPQAVARKVKENRFDWRTYDPHDPCPWLQQQNPPTNF